ncbi:hypothetical protein CDAR_597601 [Caerostris darwini]|uniref:Uncharacterized protein n=1 Tax=Caerostris darwini TaxID=1538125 RepID=A0AAV4X0F7_9ARAC|nr:hypothetical protein CDAR_597601 [Caerostris darwini]
MTSRSQFGMDLINFAQNDPLILAHSSIDKDTNGSSAEHRIEHCSEETPCSTNCKEKHPSFSKLCPKWKLELEQIQTGKVRHGVSFQEASGIARAPTPKSQSSYSSALQKTFKSVATETVYVVSPHINRNYSSIPILSKKKLCNDLILEINMSSTSKDNTKNAITGQNQTKTKKYGNKEELSEK